MNNITPKEKEVLRLLAKGLSSKEIASNLSISAHTVESHRKNLRFKFDAKNSSELIMKASEVINIKSLNSAIS
jgi:DNA-binding CsgD family transcriptional regulator